MVIPLLALTLACPPKSPPPVFVAPIPSPAPAATRIEIPAPEPDDVPSPTVVIPGLDMPYTVDGLATHRGTLLSPSDVAACLDSRAMEIYWQGAYRISVEGRTTDRIRCEDVAGSRWQYGEDLRHELRITRATTAAAGVVGFIAVGLIVAGIERVTR